ncbi:MAG: 4-alpha-glucanotransferase [Bacteroidaceae bacterium]|nr:4-alpha-glucanotransferase [Bacteroidaceae bacterium]
MKIRFLIAYKTRWGESLQVSLDYATTAMRTSHKVVDMSTTDGYCWSGEMELPKSTRRVEYHYQVVCNGNITRKEWCAAGLRQLPLDSKERLYTLCDHWRDIPAEAYLYTSAFTECFTRHQGAAPKLTYGGRTLILRVEAPRLGRGQVLAISGSHPMWGEWDTSRAVRMVETAPNVWMTTVNVEEIQGVADYKYIALDGETGQLVAWESHDNRRLGYPYMSENEVHVLSDESVNLPLRDWKGAGCVIPIFSLRSEGSFGVGDFGDLMKMIDWAALTGQRVIQILPINDTTMSHTWTDSYPYNSISIYAFHPQYIDLRALPALKNKKMRDEFEARRKELNALPQVDYEAVNNAKRAYLHQLYKEQGETTLGSEEYKFFYHDNAHWLLPYAAFSYLRDLNGTADFRVWKSHSTYYKGEVEALATHKESATHIAYHCYVQYLLHIQLLKASQYARAKGVAIKGDIPIGISRNSVEAWVEPHYFHMNGQAGAPPDAFSVNGQNWGFPTYNWEAMAADGYQWWIRRFSKMAEYFDAYRIDHVLGFFRIWEIPQHSVHGLLGQFSPAMPMTPEEISSYGLYFRKDFFTRPYIAEGIIDTLFGRLADEVRNTYLNRLGDGTYEMKPEFDTQRKVEAHFHGRTDNDSLCVRDGLYSLISNVLFIPDRKVPDTYHPRICAQNDFFYHTLGRDEQEAFNRLYEEYYYHRHNQFWYDEAMKKLPILTGATRMLVCAEDLGMVPTCVPWVMNDLRILTLEIQSMSKSPETEFGYLERNPYRSVATISTHDMSTLRGWWDEDPDRTQRFYNHMLQKAGDAPHPMPAWLCEEVVARHLYSTSMLCLLSWQDWLSMDEQLRYPDANYERINVPANPRNYWHYRMHMTIEQLMQQDAFNHKVAALIKRSGR